jgi:hypothetical protein
MSDTALEDVMLAAAGAFKEEKRQLRAQVSVFERTHQSTD